MSQAFCPLGGLCGFSWKGLGSLPSPLTLFCLRCLSWTELSRPPTPSSPGSGLVLLIGCDSSLLFPACHPFSLRQLPAVAFPGLTSPKGTPVLGDLGGREGGGAWLAWAGTLLSSDLGVQRARRSESPSILKAFRPVGTLEGLWLRRDGWRWRGRRGKPGQQAEPLVQGLQLAGGSGRTGAAVRGWVGQWSWESLRTTCLPLTQQTIWFLSTPALLYPRGHNLTPQATSGTPYELGPPNLAP